MSLLIFYFLLTAIVSFSCSILESSFLSISPAYIAVQVKRKRKFGFLLQSLKHQIDKPLAAILTLNTIANMVGATGVGAQTLKLYGDSSIALASGLLTFTILIFSEILPKTLGVTYWKQLAPVTAYTIKYLIYLTYPFVTLSDWVSRLIRKEGGSKISREEMIVTAEIGVEQGSIRLHESRVIRNLLLLDEFKIEDIMTPRSVVTAFEQSMSVEETIRQNTSLRFSRIPIFENNFDNVTGVIHKYKLLEASNQDLDNIKLHKLSSPIHTISENMSVATALDQFVKRKEHLFLVVDDYGGPTGIVTLEDCIETLLGVEIVDEFDSIIDMRKYALEKWRDKKQKLPQASVHKPTDN